MKRFQNFKERLNKILNDSHPVIAHSLRAVLISAGLLVVTVGLILVPLPGPGWLIVFFGLSIIALISRRTENFLDNTVALIKRIYYSFKNRKEPKPDAALREFTSDETVHISILQ